MKQCGIMGFVYFTITDVKICVTDSGRNAHGRVDESKFDSRNVESHLLTFRLHSLAGFTPELTNRRLNETSPLKEMKKITNLSKFEHY